MDKTNAILLVGPTGSGKTPLGELLERRGLWGRRCFHFDFGAQLRRIVASGRCEHLSRWDVEFLRTVLQTGALLEDEHSPIAEKILRRFIADCRLGKDDLLILNGLPRHQSQARHVDTIVRIQAVVVLSCTAEVIFERIHTDAGGDRAERIDDDKRAVNDRLALFTRRTAPLVEHYRTRGARIEAVTVDARTGPRDILAALDDVGPTP